MEKLGFVDIFVMVIYFIALMSIGAYVLRSKKEKGEIESFLAADRNMGLFQTTATTSATDLGGGFSIAMGGLGFSMGLAGSWLMAVSALSAIGAAFFLVPVVKKWADKCKGYTIGDLFTQRFDKKTGFMAAILIGLAWFCFVGGQIIAGGKLIAGTMGIGLSVSIIIAGAIVLFYTSAGGLKAVIYTDVFNMVVLFLGVILILIPIGWIKSGGWQGLVEQFSASAETSKLLDWGNVSWKTGIGWFLSIFPVWFISICSIQRIIAAKDESTAKKAFFLTGIPIEWPIFAIGTVLIGMFARKLIPGLTDPELAVPRMIVTMLPMGIAGLVVAGYTAAVISTADSCLMGPVAIFTNDIYKKLIKPKASDSELIKVARIATIVMGFLAIYLAYKVPSILTIVLYAYTFGAAGLFFPMLGLLFWKRTTSTGAFWSIIIGGSSAVIWTLLGSPYGFAASYLGWTTSFLTLVLVSLNTQHGSEEDIETFFPESKQIS
ncbi:sodium:solute symporter family protein [bacterium]|nr:sodium:solute symporter family protein [bacterium]MBU4362165.1 sodium:solute symporter family protein [bacterium]MBU4603012.1 sodium:solute symporter family protein [bacterium]